MLYYLIHLIHFRMDNNINFGDAVAQSPNETDNKIVKKFWPKTNNDSNLEFVFSRDPNLALVKNNISIHYSFVIDEIYLPDVGFASKQFRTLHVEVDSQLVSSTKSQFEYPLYTYLQYIGNFDLKYLMTTHAAEGFGDIISDNTDTLSELIRQGRLKYTVNKHDATAKTRTFEVIFTPCQGFLNDPDPLLPNSELRLSFERAPSSLSFLLKKEVSPAKVIDDVIKLQ